MTGTGDITGLIKAARGGDAGAADRLAVLIYDELRVLARRCLRDRAAADTLSTTALVHEAYLRFGGDAASSFADRAHFFAYASQVMRRILVDQARRKRAAIHGGDRNRVELSEGDLISDAVPEDLVDLDDSLSKLAEDDPLAAEIAKLRIFAGLSVAEAADCLGISRATANRHWAYGRAFLRAERTG